ncbi:hypothetical protein ILUMI_17462 [Ignelater luminosus]|uniref:Uncharacterized protein n=1 Tax=Ignelater luminosus TaxID=2038154 RepID=A0A8K0CN92_IGNLU|nr:hypothetical protein ILUMI_17462 [Ignelater luminosus]
MKSNDEEENLVLIPVIEIHHDPKYFTDCNKFDGERFIDSSKRNILPYSYIVLLELAQVTRSYGYKSLILHLLGKYDLTVVQLASKPLSMAPEKGMWQE